MKLEKRNIEIFYKYYTTEKTLREIGIEYGIGPDRVLEICKKYLRVMKTSIKNNADCGYRLLQKELL